jgi:hypothetical protein
MKTKIEMSEADIVRSMKNNQYSPMQICVSRVFRDTPDNIDINYDSIIIWNDEINDYDSYKYCVEDIEKVKIFLDEWHDYASSILDEFCASPISFCVEQKK